MENRNEYNSFSLLKLIWKWRKCLLIIGLSAFFISAFCSFLIRPRYKSFATIYGPRTNSVAKILLNEQSYNEKLDIKAYAIEEETEQMMQLLDAVEIKDSLIKNFNLSEYFNIDLNKKGGRAKMYKTLTNTLTIKRTDFGAITISATTWDAQLSCDIVNDVLRLLDTVKNRTEHERAEAAYLALTRQMDSINKEIQRIDDSIQVCMENGVFDVETQSERVMQQYAIAVSQGNTAAMARLQEEQKKLAIWGPKLDANQNLLHYFREYQSLCKQKMMDARLDMSNNIPVKFVVDKPYPADKKCYPKKSIVVLVSTFCVLVLALIIIILIERIEEQSNRKTEESIE